MEHLLTLSGFMALLSLTLMEILLGIDNVIFVSIVMGKMQKSDVKRASLIWMVVGIIVRILFLFFIGLLIKGDNALFTIFNHGFSIKDLVMLAGGLFLLVSTTLEIHNKLDIETAEDQAEKLHKNKSKSFAKIMLQIVLIDIIFSLDGVITAVGMVNDMPTMIIAVLFSLTFMFLFAPKISVFIEKNPTFKLLALSFLILISVLLIVEGMHVDKIHLPKGYIYFAMAFSFLVEMLNMQFRKKNKNLSIN